MVKFDKILFFEKEYEREFLEKDNFESLTTNIITLLVISITFFSYYLINTNLFKTFYFETLSEYIFNCLLLIYVLTLILIIANLIKFYISRMKYMKIPYADDLNKYFDELKAYDILNYKEEIENYLLNVYIESSTHNSKVNEYKKGIIFEIRVILFVQFICLCLTFCPFYFIKNGNLDIQTIEILGDKNVK